MSQENELNRRDFVKFISAGTVTSIGLLSSGALTSCSSSKSSTPFTTFKPIDPSGADELILADGFQYHRFLTWGDRLNSRGEKFGINNDYLAFTPLNKKGTEAILWANHEYPLPNLIHDFKKLDNKSKAMIDLERKEVGGSLVHIKKNKSGRWELVKNSSYNRRLDGFSKIPFADNKKVWGSKFAIGTFAGCAGGVTPWGSVLSCEENYQDYYGDRDSKGKVLTKAWLEWDKFYKKPPEHYGWVVEVEPKTGKAKKQTALGRFAHESATCVLANDGRTVVYSGDDKAGEFVYKFVSEKKGSLDRGELFVADVKKGKWISLDINKQPLLKKNFKDQLEVLTFAREAGALLGATKLNRPEDIKVSPKTDEVFITLTNNVDVGDYHGSIMKLSPKDGNHLSESFSAMDFAVGGEEFSCPDNLAFDLHGNLWMVTDISGSAMHKPPYTKFKNNGLFFFPMSGPNAGKPFQVASAPFDSELTGLCFTPDFKSLFVSVQHPGEKSKSADKYTSHWPLGGAEKPRSAVIEIFGPNLDRIIGQA